MEEVRYEFGRLPKVDPAWRGKFLMGMKVDVKDAHWVSKRALKSTPKCVGVDNSTIPVIVDIPIIIDCFVLVSQYDQSLSGEIPETTE